MGIRRINMAVMVACAALLGLPAAASADIQFWVVGRGFGHGIGMSQYGAKGFADRGYAAATIVKYYYDGTTVGPAPADAANVNVLLRRNLGAASFTVEAAGSLVHAGIAYPLVAGDRVTFAHTKGGISATRIRNNQSAVLYAADGNVGTLAGSDGFVRPRFTADNGASGGHYRGSILILNAGGRVEVVNRVPLDSYLRGVIPSEMPSSWAPEALKAQALAARSYALANRRSGDYDLYADTRSQMYLGMDHEQASTDTAVAQTANQVILYGGQVIPAYFSSSSGGRTAANEDVWGGAPRPYLRSKPDPYEKSPYTPWKHQLTYTPSALAKKLGHVKGKLGNVLVSANHSARAAKVKLVGSRGTSAISPTSFQVALGLRSTWFRVERLGLFPVLTQATKTSRRVARKKVAPRIRGFAPRSSATSLVYRDNGTGPWRKLKDVKPGKTGAFTLVAPRPRRGFRVYRLKRHGWLGPSVKVFA
jgi:stage II sporulation protein D